ncbi:hypothetical protein RJ641_003566 [Dillenia turbinata]|uniref:Protein arginine N-methyltransferase domain-containing protein n=1 Tax=Dillenia turbinata TaxID=194707 RepID=A0AAN8ZFB7_9MAGN
MERIFDSDDVVEKDDVEIDEEVDVIISEWMGYMLLYESMLGSVITARDRWLKPGGLILPSHATLYMAPVTHPNRYSESIDFWRNVYGIDMSAMLPLAKQCAFEEPSVETISGENVLTWPQVVEDGEWISFLYDVCLGPGSLRKLFPQFYGLATNKEVSVCAEDVLVGRGSRVRSFEDKGFYTFLCDSLGVSRSPFASFPWTGCLWNLVFLCFWVLAKDVNSELVALEFEESVGLIPIARFWLVVKHIDCHTVTVEELETVTARYSFKSMMQAPLHGFAFWFDVEFNTPVMSSASNNGSSSVSLLPSNCPDGGQRKKRTNPDLALLLSTAPEDPPTHWQQLMPSIIEFMSHVITLEFSASQVANMESVLVGFCTSLVMYPIFPHPLRIRILNQHSISQQPPPTVNQNPSLQQPLNPMLQQLKEKVDAAAAKVRWDLCTSGESVSSWKVTQSALLATLIYFYEPIEVEQDQLIEGSVTLTQSKENCRFMNIHVEYASGGRSFVKESVMR